MLLKQVIQRSPLYGLLRQARTRRALARWTPQDQAMLEFYSQFVSRGDLCVDVGANVGNRVKVFLKLGARVVAVEPQPECLAILRAAFGNDRQLTVVPKALGESEGRAEIMVSNANTISSLSPEWIEAVKRSGRFAEYRWDEQVTVDVSTLDRLIEAHGVPAFIKVDVEGFELPVVKGLSRPIRVISLEFTPEFLESTLQCIEHLRRLGEIRLNYAVGESMRLALGEWVRPDVMIGILEGFRGDHRLFGDVYVRFEG